MTATRTTPRARRVVLIGGVVVALVLVGLGAWLLVARGGAGGDGSADVVVGLGDEVTAVTGLDWPRDAEDEARRAAFVDRAGTVAVTAGERTVFDGRTSTAVLHQRADTVVAVDLQPESARGDVASATAGLRTVLDDAGLLDATTSSRLDEWVASSPDPDPLAVRDLSLRVEQDGVAVFAELQPTPDGSWFGTLEVALPPDDWPA